MADRFERYRTTDGWNLAINARQFGPGFGGGLTRKDGSRVSFLPEDTAEPTVTYEERLDLSVGGLDVALHHDRGETDDHTWAWIPALKAVAVGDFVAWVFPNAGNPQKVQRYPVDWARALRSMVALEPELLLPAHGLVVAGQERVATVLGDLATALERLVADVLAGMNAGRRSTRSSTRCGSATTCSPGRGCAPSTTSRSSWCATRTGSSAAGGTATPPT
ncbi:MAG: hypothetical protein R2711_05550 [Acidimicrobiales bacterium]